MNAKCKVTLSPRQCQNPGKSQQTEKNKLKSQLGCFVAWRSSVPFIFLALKTFQNHPKPSKTLQRLFWHPQANAPRPHQTLFSWPSRRHQYIFTAFKPAVCQASNPSKPYKTPPNPQNPPKALLARLTPQANAPRPHQQLFLGLQGAITNFLLAFKPAVCQASNPSIPSKTPQNPQELTKKGFFSTPDPAGQRTKATSTAFSWPSRRNQ